MADGHLFDQLAPLVNTHHSVLQADKHRHPAPFGSWKVPLRIYRKSKVYVFAI
jgi:hypothetical protein